MTGLKLTVLLPQPPKFQRLPSLAILAWSLNDSSPEGEETAVLQALREVAARGAKNQSQTGRAPE